VRRDHCRIEREALVSRSTLPDSNSRRSSGYEAGRLSGSEGRRLREVQGGSSLIAGVSAALLGVTAPVHQASDV
jgi:hypothetical protein